MSDRYRSSRPLLGGCLCEHCRSYLRSHWWSLVRRCQLAIYLISARVLHPIFARELLAASQLLRLAVNLQNPVKARVLIKVNSSTSATDLARNLHDKPQQWLRFPESQLLFYSQPPEVQSHDNSKFSSGTHWEGGL